MGKGWWTQGGAFSENGLYFRVVDDKEHEYSAHTGLWVYQLDYPIIDGSFARRIGFIHIPYDSEICVPFDDCYREEELEGLDVSNIAGGKTAGDVHIMMLDNDGNEDDVSVFHYQSGDVDGDGINDTVDNCVWVPNPDQHRLDIKGIGTACDVRVFVPSITLPIF